jgi:hypothetical protein
MMAAVFLAAMVLAGYRFRQDRLDESGFTIVLKGAEANYLNAKLTREVAELALKEYDAGIYRQDLQTVNGEIALAESNLRRARDRVSWTEKMHIKQQLEKGQLAYEQLAIQQAKYDLEQSQTKKHVLEDYTKEKTLKELRSEVE